MADSIQPNFIKQNPDGTVAAVFSGGVELTPADLSKGQQPQAENSVQWIRQADGALVAEVYSQVQDPGGIAGTASTQILTYDPEARGGQLYLSAQQSPTNQDGAASVSVNSGSTGNVGSVTASANNGSGSQSFVHIIKGDGTSDFLQLDKTRRSAAGTGTLTFPGGSTKSNNTNVAIGYPTGLLLTGTYCSDNGASVICGWGNYGNGFNVFAITADGHAPAAGVTVEFSYLAWF